MHEADREVWLAIERGDQAPDWDALLGHPAGTDYLTEMGRQVAARIKQDLTAFFGPNWVAKAVGPDRTGQQPAIPGLDAVSPVLSPHGSAGAYAEAVRWWASLQLLVERDVPGTGLVQRQARKNIKLDRLLHTLVQARLAAIGAYLGAEVALEPEKTGGGPGDVLLHAGDAEVFIEVVTLGADATLLQRSAAFDNNFQYLLSLELAHDVHFVGDVPSLLPDYKLAAWRRRVCDAALRCVLAGAPVEIQDDDGRSLSVRPGSAPAGTTLSTSHPERDQGARLQTAIEKKAGQTADAGVAWIWAEDHGALYPFTQFADAPLARKVDLVAELAEQVLADYPHVAGIVLSSVIRRGTPPTDEKIERPAGYGFRRHLPLDRVRETLIIPRRVVLLNQTRLLARMCDQEPRWLNWALDQLGVPTGITGLINQLSIQPTSPLWTPGS